MADTPEGQDAAVPTPRSMLAATIGTTSLSAAAVSLAIAQQAAALAVPAGLLAAQLSSGSSGVQGLLKSLAAETNILIATRFHPSTTHMAEAIEFGTAERDQPLFEETDTR